MKVSSGSVRADLALEVLMTSPMPPDEVVVVLGWYKSAAAPP